MSPIEQCAYQAVKEIEKIHADLLWEQKRQATSRKAQHTATITLASNIVNLGQVRQHKCLSELQAQIDEAAAALAHMRTLFARVRADEIARYRQARKRSHISLVQ